MSIVFPVTPVPIPTFPISNITPFTYKDGMTYLELLESMRNWLTNNLVPEYQSEITELIATVTEALETQSVWVNNENQELTNYVDAQVLAIIEDSVTVQDPVVASMLTNPTSDTRIVSDNLYAPKSIVSIVNDFVDIINEVGGRLTEDYLDDRYRKNSDVVPVTDGGSGRNTSGTAFGIIAAGTSATGVQQTINPGSSGHFLKSNGGGALAEFVELIKDSSAGANTVWSSSKVDNFVRGFNLFGEFGDRPLASSVEPGTNYICTDVPEILVSDGSTWHSTGGSGSELGYASGTAAFNTASTTGQDVPGLSVTFVAGTRPIRVELHGRVAGNAVGEQTRLHILLDGVEIQRHEQLIPYANAWNSVYAGVRIGALTPGSTHTVKVQLSTNGVGPARMGGDPTLPYNLQVTAL